MKKGLQKLLSPDSMLLPSHQAVQASVEPVVPVVVESDGGKACRIEQVDHNYSKDSDSP